jgi:hypothetical protein
MEHQLIPPKHDAITIRQDRTNSNPSEPQQAREIEDMNVAKGWRGGIGFAKLLVNHRK